MTGPQVKTNNRMPTLLKGSAFFICVVLLLATFFSNTRILAAEWYAIPARHMLAKDPAGYRDSDFGQALDNTDRALAFLPGNPDYHALRGHLSVQRCRNWNVVERWTPWQVCQQEAMAHWRAVTVQNSQWPVAWANLMQVKFNLRQFDSEFFQAMDRVSVLGRHEMDVNRVLAYIGLREWSRWTPAQQAQVKWAMLALHQAWPRQAKQVADQAGLPALYCYWTAGDPRQPKACKRRRGGRKMQQAPVS